MVRKHLILPLIPVLAAIPAVAQEAEKPYNGHGYVHFHTGVCQHGVVFSGVGGGGEGFFYRGLGVGADLSSLAQYNRWDESVGTFAIGPTWHFTNRTRSQRIVPFLSGGYLIAFREGYAHGAYFGGGLTWWFRPRVGLRFEVRDQIVPVWEDNQVMFRFGLSFR